MANGITFKPEAISSATASSTATGYDALNVGIDNMGNIWRSDTGSGSQSLTIDLGADTAFDIITLHGLSGAMQTWQWMVEIATEAQGPFSGSYWSDSTQTLLAGAVSPTNGRGKSLWASPAGAPSVGRYIRLAFSGLSGAAIEIARVCIGSKIQLEQNFSYGAALGVRSLGQKSFNKRGLYLGRSGVNLRGIGLTCEGATRDEVEGLVMPLLEQVGNDIPVVLIVDPDPDAQRQNRIYFGPLQGDLGTVFAGYDRFVWRVNLVALD